jgi:hypothetical protein
MPEELQLNWIKDIVKSIPACRRGIRRALIFLPLLCIEEFFSLKSHHLALYAGIVVECCLTVPVNFAIIKSIAGDVLKKPELESLPLTNAIFFRLFSVLVITIVVSFPSLIFFAVLWNSLKHNPGLAEAIFMAVVNFVSMIFVVPATWWLVKSSLANVLVSVDDAGIIGGLRKSHQMIDGHFWLTFKYFLPNFIFINAPIGIISLCVRDWYKQILASGASDPVLFGGGTVWMLVEVMNLLVPLCASAAQIVCLHAYLKEHQKTTAEVVL